ncbi:hypothetical protein niasHS_013933 [Heterodera schachtii]|uniref:Metalloendopeptidase n=1 Tax=Heterodera schachtii TaxID=97005 RepID=A0ABD2IKI0_HETSC
MPSKLRRHNTIEDEHWPVKKCAERSLFLWQCFFKKLFWNILSQAAFEELRAWMIKFSEFVEIGEAEQYDRRGDKPWAWLTFSAPLNMKCSLLSYPFIGISLILVVGVASSIGAPGAASGRKIKPPIMERGAVNKGTKPTEMGKEEAEQWKKEREEVKKLLAEHNEKVQKKLLKQAKALEKDEKYQQRMKEQKAARARLPKEKRVPTMDIPEINEHSPEAAYLYQGDIQLSLEEAKILFARDDDVEVEEGRPSTRTPNASSDAVDSSGRRRRGAPMHAGTFPDSKWPNLQYPFSFDDSISDQLKGHIKKALKLWYNNTCLNLYEDPKASPRVHFTSHAGKGCSSAVGRQKSQTYQEVSLAPGCDRLGIIAHEIGHSLGFFHEQSRYDRDAFVEVNTDNIEPEMLYNFDKQSNLDNNNYYVGYDLGSVMHYSSKGFSINDEPTLVPKAGPMYLHTIGQRYGPSHSDYKMMNEHYCGLSFNSANSNSSRNKVTCEMETTCFNGGFQNPNKCSACICPPGYWGEKCENTLGSHSPIGVPKCTPYTVVTTHTHWTEMSEQTGATTLDENADFAYCVWVIKSQKTIYIEVLEVGDVCSDGCKLGNTEIRTSANRGDTGVRLCCQDDLGGPNKTLSITASNGYAMITLYAYKGIQRFRLRWRHD